MTEPPATSLSRGDDTVAGLDTIRFLAALCVAFSHGAVFPLVAYVPEKVGLWRLIVGTYSSLFNGVAAVFVFFIVSGFCIHYRFATGAPFRPLPFLCRRLLRIAVPMLCAAFIARLVGPQAITAMDAVIWTLYCEMIYYALYPLLRFAFRRFGVLSCTVASAMPAVALILWRWDFAYHWKFAIALTSLVCLPTWLLGCLLAETVARRKPVAAGRDIWVWRTAGWGYAAFAFFWFFHGPIKIGYPALLIPFTVYLFFWMEKEIAYFHYSPPPKMLEWAGGWSYSIYLMHGTVMVLAGAWSHKLSPVAFWLMQFAAILGGCYIFFLAVERPSQQLARTVGHRLARAHSRPPS